MSRNLVSAFLATCSLGLTTAPAWAEDLWSIYDPACNANGIDPDRCLCILDTVVTNHGEAAARYVGLDMVLRYDEAAAILEQIGEDKAFAAGDSFDLAQNKDCSAGRIARLKGTYVNGETGEASASATATEATRADESTSALPTNTVLAKDATVLDLRDHPNGGIVDVSSIISDEVWDLIGGSNTRNFLGFFRVADLKGGIDLSGDGKADVHPGEPGYGQHVQRLALSTKLYFSESAGKSQVLGDIQLDGGALYAPYIRFKGAAGGASGMPTDGDMAAMQDFLRNGMAGPHHLFFPFRQANIGGIDHIQRLTDNSFGFEDVKGGADEDFDDVVFVMQVTAL